MKRKTPKKKAAKKKSSAKHKNSNFLKYLFVFVIVASGSYFLFLNRHEINGKLSERISLTQEKIIPYKKNAQVGYKKVDRIKLEKLIHEETKND